MISTAILLSLCAYLLGSVPWGVILTRLLADVDIRKAGSGNIGAYNVFRLAGMRLGIATLVADILKGALPTLVAVYWFEDPGWKGEFFVCLVAMCAFVGHLYPLFLGFKGGKGAATAAGCFLVMSPPLVFVACVLVYVLVLCVSGYSSAGSLSAAAVAPWAAWLATHSIPITVFALAVALLIFVRHSDNIKRLLDGTEHSSLRS